MLFARESSAVTEEGGEENENKPEMSCRQSVRLLNFGKNLYKYQNFNRNLNIFSHKLLPEASCVFLNYTIPVRCKYGGKSKNPTDRDEESDSDADLNDELKEKGTNLIKCSVTSMRADLIIKTGLGLARNKVEVKFYEGRIRVNGRKISKKSHHVNIGDEIDVVKGFSPTNPDHLNISRVEIVSATPKEESISLILRRFKTLLIENYEERNAYKESSSTEG
ncbi:Mitochondrial transcription rescue factor 1 [Sergentomyia squamirostris]